MGFRYDDRAAGVNDCNVRPGNRELAPSPAARMVALPAIFCESPNGEKVLLGEETRPYPACIPPGIARDAAIPESTCGAGACGLDSAPYALRGGRHFAVPHPELGERVDGIVRGSCLRMWQRGQCPSAGTSREGA
jgi:hypothetical protein